MRRLLCICLMLLCLMLSGCSKTLPLIPDAFVTPNTVLVPTAAIATPTPTEELLRAEYILPESSTRALTVADVELMEETALALARNEIYARHGFPFQSEQYVSHFSAKAWYSANADYSDSMLSDVELMNIEFLSTAENMRKVHGALELDGVNALALATELPCARLHTEFSADASEAVITCGEDVWRFSGEQFAGTVYLADLDHTDGFMELILPDAGAQPSLLVLGYADGQIAALGRVEGTMETLTLLGGGKLTGMGPGQVLFSWMHEKDYRLTESRTLEQVPREEYALGLSLTMKDKLKLAKEPDGSGHAFTVDEGDSVVLTGTDDAAFVAVRRADDEELGYFRISGTTLADGREAQDVFAGLSE